MTTHSPFNTYRLCMRLLIGASVLSIFAYVGLTMATVFSTAERTALSNASQGLTAEISVLENSYFTLDARATAEEAALRGFVAPTHVSFVARSQNAGALSLRGQ